MQYRTKTFVTLNVLWSMLATMVLSPAAQAVPPPKFSTDMMGFVLTGAYTTPGGQPTGTGSFNNSNVGAYPESSCIPASIHVTNTDKKDPTDVNFEIVFDYKHQGNPTDVVGIESLKSITTALSGDPRATADDLNDFTFTGNDLTAATQFPGSTSTASAVITGPYSGGNGTNPVAATDSTRHYNVSLPGVPSEATVYMLFCAQLGPDASQFPGASLSLKPQGGGGGGSLSITISELLELPSLTIEKIVSGGTATADQWSFNVSPSINGQGTYNIASGQTSVTIPNVTPDGDYVITEGTGPTGYAFTSATGTNCTFQGDTGTAALHAAKPAANAVCSFTNTFSAPFVATTGTLTVIKQVVNDNGGDATPPDFTLTLAASGTTPTNFAGSANGTVFIIQAGAYGVTEATSTTYTSSFSTDCTGTMDPGENLTCTVTNDDIPQPPAGSPTGTIQIIKTVINDNGGTGTASDFSLTLAASGTTPISFSGNASGTSFVVATGAYSVTEASSTSYLAGFSTDCAGTLAAGETRTCTVTNNDILPPFVATTGTLTVIKQVVNDNGRTNVASDFTLNLYYASTSATSTTQFPGNASGTKFVLEAGHYKVTEQATSIYNVSYDNCEGAIAAGQNITCYVNNDDLPTGPVYTGTIRVIKQVVHSFGRPEKASDFTLSATYPYAPQQTQVTRVTLATAAISNTAATSFRGSETGTLITASPGPYQVTEREDANYVAEYSAGCQGTVTAGVTVTCTITNTDRPYGSSGGGGGGGGWGYSTIAPTTIPAAQPAGRVLGVEDSEPMACVLTEPEALFVPAGLDAILNHLGRTRDQAMEAYYNRVLTPRIVPEGTDPALLANVQNFVNYGTFNTLRLGQGERAGVVNSYREAFGRLPVTECDWQNVLKIANTKLPADLLAARELGVVSTFQKIYGRAPNDVLMDRIAHMLMAYGVRPQARDLKAEWEASRVHLKLFGKLPATASEWDATRAIAYSGLPQSLLKADLSNATGRIYAFLADGASLSLK